MGSGLAGSGVSPWYRGLPGGRKAEDLAVLQRQVDPARVADGRATFDHGGRKLPMPKVRTVFEVQRSQESARRFNRLQTTQLPTMPMPKYSARYFTTDDLE